MHPVLAPRARATVIEAAEETGTVLPVQAFVREVVLLVIGQDVVHLQQGRPGSNVHQAGRLLCVAGFGLLVLPIAGEVVQCAVLHERGEGEDETHGHEQVHGGHVGHFGQRLPGDGAERCHGEHCGDAQRCARRDSVLVDPEGDPGQDHDHAAGDVRLDGEVAHPPTQVKEDGHDHILTGLSVGHIRSVPQAHKSKLVEPPISLVRHLHRSPLPAVHDLIPGITIA